MSELFPDKASNVRQALKDLPDTDVIYRTGTLCVIKTKALSVMTNALSTIKRMSYYPLAVRKGNFDQQYYAIFRI